MERVPLSSEVLDHAFAEQRDACKKFREEAHKLSHPRAVEEMLKIADRMDAERNRTERLHGRR